MSTRARPVPRRKARPTTDTQRVARAQARTLLVPWWARHGAGWSQPYPVVHSVITLVVARGMPAEQVVAALDVLAQARRPVSVASLMLAAAPTASEVREQTAYERADKYRSAETYTQRTL